MTDPVTPGRAAATLLSVLADRVQTTPDAIALTGSGVTLTFLELDEQANQLARTLAEGGLQPGDRVALLAGHHPVAVTAFLAALKAGGIVVGLDPAAPVERTRAVLADAAPSVTLTYKQPLPCPAPGRRLDLAAPTAYHPNPSPLERAPKPSDLAHLLYPTPRPGEPVAPGTAPTLPGVVTDYAALATLVLDAMPGDLLFHHDDPVALATSGPHQTTFLLDTVLPLARGVRVAIASPGELADPAALTALVGRERVTVVAGTPAALAQHLASADRCPWLAGVQVLALRARDFPDGFWDELRPATSALLVRLYGPPECGGVVTFSPVLDPDAVGLGYPVPNLQAYVVGHDGVPVRAGQAGELCVAGPLVARGYWHEPAWARDRFIPSEEGEDRLFCTGDQVRWQPDGQLQLLGTVSPGHPTTPSVTLDDTASGVFQSAVAAAPDARAITETSGLGVTYAMLDLGARRLAAALRAQGVRRGARVALLTGRGVDFYCGLLGILYAGAAYVPLAPSTPAAAVAARLAAAEVAVAVIDDWALAEKTGILPVVCLADPALSRQPAAAPEPVSPDDLAAYIFVDKQPWLLTQGDLARSARAAADRLGLEPADRVLAYAAPDEPGAAWEWSQALLSGASLRTVPADVTRDVARLRDALGGVTVATLPAFVAALVRPLGLRALATTGATPADVAGFDGHLVHLAAVAEPIPAAPPAADDPAALAQALRAWPGVADAAVIGPDGYIAAPPGLDADAVLAEVAAALPVAPARLQRVDAIPRDADGAPDLRALPDPDGDAPSLSPAEAALQAAYARVFGPEAAARDANLFALGGDDAAVLELRDTLAADGWTVSAADLLAGRTPAAVAPYATRSGPAPADQAEVVGPVDLTPRQVLWLAAHPGVWPAARMTVLARRDPFDPAALRAALAAVARHHDALRGRLADGYSEYRAAGVTAPPPLDVTVLAETPADLSPMADAATALQDRLDPVHGPVLAAHLWRTPAGDQLVVAVSRFTADDRSFGIVVQDLVTAYAQTAAGRPVDLGLKSASVRAWVQALAAAAVDPAVGAQLPLWREHVTAVQQAQLPLAAPGGAAGAAGNSGRRNLTLGLGAEQSQRLLTGTSQAYGTTVHDLIVAATAWAAHEVFGLSAVALEVEGEGRRLPGDPLDLSRTVGALAHPYPVVVPTSPIVAQAIVAAKEVLRGVPLDGLGYALLAPLPGSGVTVEPNLAVRFGAAPVLTGLEGLALSDWPVAGPDPLRAPNPVRLTVAAHGESLGLGLAYDAGRLDEATAWRFLVAVRDGLGVMIEHCAAQPTRWRTPADVGLAELDDVTLGALNAVAEDPREP
ncbi:MAG: AMP-binding protein [Propionibacteriaceae bacterium]|jgi:non-ribosomal peptide synthetase component F|nr:AMP-binding protein [Propionibacteriaceae bacterium]